MSIDALRERVVHTPVQYRAVWLLDEDSFDALDELVTTDLYLQTAQLAQTLLLDDGGHIVADGLVGRREEGFLLALDGVHTITAVAAQPMHETHSGIGLHGPFAWELLGEWLGPDLIGMPYLSSFSHDDALVLRAGNTGEYGYEVWLPRERAEGMRQDLYRCGARFDLAAASKDDLVLAALENGFFDLGAEGQRLRDPLALQLRWRLSNDKDYRGRDAIERRLANGLRQRVTWLSSSRELAIGGSVEAFGETIGEIVHAAYSPRLGRWVAIANLAIEWAHAGIDGFECAHGDARAAVRTVSPPLVDNWSLRVSPQRHSYHAREHMELPG